MSNPISKSTFDNHVHNWKMYAKEDLHEVFQINGSNPADYLLSFKLDKNDGLEDLLDLSPTNFYFHMACRENLDGVSTLFYPIVEAVGTSGDHYYGMEEETNFIEASEPINPRTATHFRNAMKYRLASGNLSTLWEAFHCRDSNKCAAFGSSDARVRYVPLQNDSSGVNDFMAIVNKFKDGSGNFKGDSVLRIHLGYSSITSLLQMNFKLVVEADDGTSSDFFEFSSPCPHNCKEQPSLDKA